MDKETYTYVQLEQMAECDLEAIILSSHAN